MKGVVFVRRKAHNRGFAVAKTMWQAFRLGVFLSTLGQFATKCGSKTHAGLFSEKWLHDASHVLSDSNGMVDRPLTR